MRKKLTLILLIGCVGCSGDDESGNGTPSGPGADGGIDALADGAAGASGDATPDGTTPDTGPDAGADALPDAATDVADAGESPCGFDPTGTPGTPDVTLDGPPSVLDDKSGEAQNQGGGNFGALPPERFGVLARSDCGDVGAVLRISDPQATNPPTLVFVDLVQDVSTPEVVDSPVSDFESALLYDDACSPVVIRVSGSDGFLQYTRSGSTWSSSIVDPDLPALIGSDPSSFHLHHAGVGAGGAWHMVATARVGDTTWLVHGTRAAAATGTWDFAAAEVPPDTTELFQVRAGPSGALHALFGTIEFPCDPCNLDLHHGLLAAPGATWEVTTVQPGLWGPPHDELTEDPSLVVDGEGRPWVAATFVTRAVTGSKLSTELRYYGKQGGSWCAETVATENDGYAGSDGTQFTGATPHLQLDGSGRPHVVFADRAQWHDGQGWANGMVGQVRHAVRAGVTWHLSTLLQQDGQTVSSQPLLGFDWPTLSVAPDGSSFTVIGAARTWDTDSIYNDEPKPLTLRAMALRGSAGLP